MLKPTIIISTFFVLCMASCIPEGKKADQNNQTTELQKSLYKASETLLINAEKGGQVTGKEGTVLKFPPNIFEFDDGTEVKGKVDLEITEFYSSSDMLFNNLRTMSGDKLLETGGMLYCKASSGGREVSIKKGETFTICFPTKGKQKAEDMYLFISSERGESWELEGDTIRDTNFGLSRFFEQDTIVSPDEMDRISQEYKSSLEYYVFEATSLSWKNCDRFVFPLGEEEELMVMVDTELKPVVRLVYRENNSISPGYMQPDNRIKFWPLALGQQATLFGFSKVNGKVYMAQKDVLITAKMEQVDLVFMEVSLDELKSAAKSLEWQSI